MSESIDRAAIRYGDCIYSVPRPGRHHNVIRLMAAAGLGSAAMHDQGFTTSAGRFVDRTAAADIARSAGQIKAKNGPEDMLFSEDLW